MNTTAKLHKIYRDLEERGSPKLAPIILELGELMSFMDPSEAPQTATGKPKPTRLMTIEFNEPLEEPASSFGSRYEIHTDLALNTLGHIQVRDYTAEWSGDGDFTDENDDGESEELGTNGQTKAQWVEEAGAKYDAGMDLYFVTKNYGNTEGPLLAVVKLGTGETIDELVDVSWKSPPLQPVDIYAKCGADGDDSNFADVVNDIDLVEIAHNSPGMTAAEILSDAGVAITPDGSCWFVNTHIPPDVAF
jgi:hypothetical protein